MADKKVPSKEMGSASISSTQPARESKGRTRLPPSLGEITSAINATGLESGAGQSSRSANIALGNTVVSTNLSHQNAVSNQQRLNQTRLATLGKAVNRVGNLQPIASRSAVDVLSNNSLAELIADLKAVLEAFSPASGRSSRSSFIGRALKVLEAYIARQESFSGDGSFDNPLKINSANPQLFLTLPFQLGFKGLSPDQVKIGTGGEIT